MRCISLTDRYLPFTSPFFFPPFSRIHNKANAYPMAQSNADRLLSRITSLHRSLQLDEGGSLSAMERDLMLGYLRELYEIYAKGVPVPAAPRAASVPPPSRPMPEHTPPLGAGGPPPPPAPEPPVMRQPDPTPVSRPVPPPVHEPVRTATPPVTPPPSVQAPPQPTPAPQLTNPTPPPVPDAPVPPPPAPAYTANVVRTSPEPVTPTPPPPAPPTSFAPAAAPDNPPQPPEGGSARATANQASTGQKIGPQIEQLFTESTPTTRFARQPLADLTKALSINSRLLFTSDLFGGDGDLLNITLRTLNSAGAMSGARPVLENIAEKYDWASEEKQETAREFIELVRRRYA